MQLSEQDLAALWKSDPELARSIVSKLERRVEEETDPPYVDALFDVQKDFFADGSPRKVAVCGRRSGKTEGVAAWLLDGARQLAGGLSVYIALSRNNCRLILWSTLIAINERHGLNLWFREQDNQLIVQCPNGHRIWLAGCKDSAEIEKFRGVKLKRAAIDEAASYGSYLRDLVFDVLEPALLDYKGEICMVGTPGAIPAGLFYEASTGDGGPQWSTHHWCVLNNPYIPHAAKWLAQKKVENKWTDDHPTYQREWLGNWVSDLGSLVYPFNAERNIFHKRPDADNGWVTALGIDVGYEDSTAFVVGCYRRGHPEIYILHVEKRAHMIPSSVAVRIIQLQKQFDCYSVIMDTGGIGKAYAQQASDRYGIHIEPARKTEKRAHIEIVRGELLTGNIKLDPRHTQPLIDEWTALVWKEDRSGPDERFEDHAADAALYLIRELMPRYKPEEDEGNLTERQKIDREMSKLKAATMKQQRDKMRRRMRRGQVMAEISNPAPRY